MAHRRRLLLEVLIVIAALAALATLAAEATRWLLSSALLTRAADVEVQAGRDA